MFRRAIDYNRETQKIVYSRNVKFDEREKLEQPEEEAEAPTQRVEFDVLTELPEECDRKRSICDNPRDMSLVEKRMSCVSSTRASIA